MAAAAPTTAPRLAASSGAGAGLSSSTSASASSTSTTASSAALSPQLRSTINAALVAQHAVPAIQAALLHECQAAGLTAAVRARAHELLRSGACASYGELLARVLGEVRRASSEDGARANGESGGATKGGASAAEAGLRVPRRVIEEGVRVVRAALEQCVEIVEVD